MRNYRLFGLELLEWATIAAVILLTVGAWALSTGFKLEISAWTAPFEMLDKAEKLTPGVSTTDFLDELEKTVWTSLRNAIVGRGLIALAIIFFTCLILGLPFIVQILRKW